MLRKGSIYAAVAAFGAFAAFTEASAQPGPAGFAFTAGETVITKVGYDYYGDYEERDYHRGNPLELPFLLIGGVAGAVGSILNGVFDDSEDCAPAYYTSPYYGSPYRREAYNYSSYDNSRYERGGYYFDSRDDGDTPYKYRSHSSEYERNIGYDYSYYYPEVLYRR